MLRKIVIVGLLLYSVYSSAIRSEHDKRTKEKDLADVEHETNGEHNMDYDHEAFLGREEAKTFDELSPEESKEKLGGIVDKIDTDKDGFISQQEMIAWIKYIQKRYITEDAKRQWSYYEKEDGDFLMWDEYQKRTFGFLEETNQENDEDGFSYKEMKARDERRFKLADTDNDNKLSAAEFVNFLHPEDAEHMRDIVIMETMEDIDKNNDGFIDEKEYIGDMWPNNGNEEEPEWVASEREQFSKYRDLNSDGKMDKEEVKHWIMPDDYDHAIAESRHLIFEADADKDGKLTKQEIIDKYDLFVGSQATDFGEALMRSHDEF